MRWDLTVLEGVTFLIALKPVEFGEEEEENRIGKVLFQETSLLLHLKRGGVLAPSYY